jgi:TrmH family RNA methyltransferase
VELVKLHDPRRRRAAGLTLVEGPHQLADVLASGAAVDEVFALEGDDAAFDLARSASLRATPVSHGVLRKVAGTEHPRGPVAVVRIPPADPLASVDTVVLWDVSDPGNAGAIIRSAAAFGYAVASTPGSVDVWAPKVIRAAAATQFGNRISQLAGSSLEFFQSLGMRTFGSVVHGGEDIRSVSAERPVALLVGNEAHGLPPGISAAVDVTVTIPLAGGVESLNAAVAAGIAMFALRRPDRA